MKKKRISISKVKNKGILFKGKDKVQGNQISIGKGYVMLGG